MVLSEIQWIEEMTERGRGGEEERERDRERVFKTQHSAFPGKVMWALRKTREE